MMWRNQDEQIQAIIDFALAEDVGDGDVTSICTVPAQTRYHGEFLVKAAGVSAGLDVAVQVFKTVDESIVVETHVADGSVVTPGDVIATVDGPGRSVLTAERTALNFLQRMSGIATATRRYVEAVAGTGAVILDTRKTAPGQRLTDKQAVALGGGENHRIGLFDMALIKENHIAAAGGISAAVARCVPAARARAIEVEVRTLAELDEALALDVDRIMLDNMGLAEMLAAVARTAGRVKLEASGGVNLATVRAIAETGVDYISVDALTHSVTALDVSFLLEDAIASSVS
ncbi:MAG: carboxylating nicotinate-nucleotide diphosphorylase [Caldilineaceae bacterium]